MAPRKTRGQGEAVFDKKELEQPQESTPAKVKSKVADTQGLKKALQENDTLKQELENMKLKYSEQKRTNKELKRTIADQEQKIAIQDNYIVKLKKDRKKAEQIHKNSVTSLVTTSAQNQALMAVLTQQQSVQPTLYGPPFTNNIAIPQPIANGMLHQSLYPWPAAQNLMQQHLIRLDQNNYDLMYQNNVSM